MRILGKISVGVATVLSGSWLTSLASNDPKWLTSTIDSYAKQKFPKAYHFVLNLPTGPETVGFLISHYPCLFLRLTQYNHWLLQIFCQEIISLAILPQGFNFNGYLDESTSTHTLLFLTRNALLDENYHANKSEVFEKEEKELWVAFHQLLLSLPYTEECTEWLTQFAFHGGKTGHNLYKTIFWHSEDEDNLETTSSVEEIILFMKALRKHSEVKEHRGLIMENNGLDVLRLVVKNYDDVRITRLVCAILGNLAVDVCSCDDMIRKGWLRDLQEWIKSMDSIVKSHSLRTLMNLERNSELDDVFEDGIFVVAPETNFGRVEVDLVFLHGLRGGPFRTWRSRRETSTETCTTDCWPRDWLPVDLPECRVIVVEYDTELSGWTSKCPVQSEGSTIDYRVSKILSKLMNAGVGKRPVVWICHSLGGLTVKQILSNATSSSDYCFLLANTRAFIFYAVPHRGSDIASMAAGKARYFLLPSVDVKVLQKETQPAKIIRNTTIVSVDSADIGIGEFVPLLVDHINVCKPCSRSDPAYTKSVSFIKHVILHDHIDDYIPVLLF
ncbi:protein SERAC1-like isoform X2 [Xenia sp. Carnegie-2017]|uniref:protein SERAC1-like isoform X2 n=1 Tax=Xenia sp. Carnegie-2017 TaxID=2897299 RepID=UPI001F04CC13|nr:protein SERAC1-like isoform X2 [Xenia sp. Carnegie-2017]